MLIFRFVSARCARFLSVVAALNLVGCGTNVEQTDLAGARPTLALLPFSANTASTYREVGGNGSFDQAEFVDTTNQTWVVEGRIEGSDDVDVYDLGPVEPGDRILVTLSAEAQLTPALAQFDGSGSSLLVNDHRNVYLGQQEPFIDIVTRRSSNACYVAISSTPGFPSSGDYSLVVQREFVEDIPATRPDTILLVFSGGDDVVVGSRAPVDVPAFDAASLSSRYAGRTSVMLREVVRLIRADFSGLNVTILSTSEGAIFDGTMSRIFFGTLDDALLGVAEGVDEYNAINSQEAIIFTDTFTAFMVLEPSVGQMSQALANVASHEIGHLLGLVHTSDPAGIMDVTASLSELMDNQEFSTSPFFSSVFPIGAQNAIQLLLDSVGGDEAVATARVGTLDDPKRTAAARRVAGVMPARSDAVLSMCSLNEH